MPFQIIAFRAQNFVHVFQQKNTRLLVTTEYTDFLFIFQHIYHKQSTELEAFAECILNLHSCEPAVLVTVLIEQLSYLRVLLKHLGFDAVYIRDDLLKPVVGYGRFTWCDVAVVIQGARLYESFAPILNFVSAGAVLATAYTLFVLINIYYMLIPNRTDCIIALKNGRCF